MANVTKQASTRLAIVKRSMGQSAVEKASYISRSILVNEYDGQTYRPKYHEDLVHSEITLPPNASKEYADRAALWNSVELSEKRQDAQLARMLKASLPNEWSYELAEEVVRDYVQRNFVDKGMCADWAIHDSENEKGQRNLHIHVLLTLRPIMENGKWGAKYAKIKNAAVSVKNEVLEMIAKVRERKGRLDLPIVSGKHLRKISDRTALQSADNAEKFIATRKESLSKFTADKEQQYGELETVHLSKGQKLNRLKELSKMYALYAPVQATYKESQSLKGFAKMKYDKEHKDSLSKYPELKERMQNLLQNDEKITPKQWKAEIQSLQAEYDSIGKEKSKTAAELAYAEVISYNKKNLERELQNESRQHNKQQSRTKRREEEL
ncbi:MAG: MobA/MobL family protein [Lachnospiraceae bacterium]|nr:MobA/MobL family protein [Lachnospiraceae bacterium]